MDILFPLFGLCAVVTCWYLWTDSALWRVFPFSISPSGLTFILLLFMCLFSPSLVSQDFFCWRSSTNAWVINMQLCFCFFKKNKNNKESITTKTGSEGGSSLRLCLGVNSPTCTRSHLLWFVSCIITSEYVTFARSQAQLSFNVPTARKPELLFVYST